MQSNQQNILSENVGDVRLLQRPLENQYCYLRQIFLGYADVKWSKTINSIMNLILQIIVFFAIWTYTDS